MMQFEKEIIFRGSVIKNEITPVYIISNDDHLQELVNARTFGDIYIELVKMKMNLLSLDIFEDVDITMDVRKCLYCVFLILADFPTIRDTDIMVRINVKEARPLRLGIQGSISTTGDDAGLV